MGGLFRKPWLLGLGLLFAVPMAQVGQVGAEVKTDSAGSIIVFPKVVSTEFRDTLIKITNRSNVPAQLHCYYVNASGLCSFTGLACTSDSDCLAGTFAQDCVGGTCEIDGNSCDGSCPPARVDETCDDIQWQANNFDVFLTAQQPTMWRASDGRLSDVANGASACELGEPCSCSIDEGRLNCPGFPPTGSPGVLPLGENFIGELKCYQTNDDFQTPLAGNAIIGEAIIENGILGQVSQYNALTITANPSMTEGVNTDNDLLLNWTGEGPGEYNRCPEALVLNHVADGAPEKQVGNITSLVRTELTLVPCTEIFESDDPQIQEGGIPARANVVIINEFEQLVASAPFSFDCFLNSGLSELRSEFSYGTIGSYYAKTRLTPPTGNVCMSGTNRGQTCTTDDENETTGCPGRSQTAGGVSLGCRPWPGLIGVAEEFYGPFSIGGTPFGSDENGVSGKWVSATAAYNIHMEGQRSGAGDVVVAAELDTGN